MLSPSPNIELFRWTKFEFAWNSCISQPPNFQDNISKKKTVLIHEFIRYMVKTLWDPDTIAYRKIKLLFHDFHKLTFILKYFVAFQNAFHKYLDVFYI